LAPWPEEQSVLKVPRVGSERREEKKKAGVARARAKRKIVFFILFLSAVSITGISRVSNGDAVLQVRILPDRSGTALERSDRDKSELPRGVLIFPVRFVPGRQ
jgi:hypothetical protein